jgi:hypothetical protein
MFFSMLEKHLVSFEKNSGQIRKVEKNQFCPQIFALREILCWKKNSGSFGFFLLPK